MLNTICTEFWCYNVCRVIRLSSPNLNYLIGIGAIILYINIITLTIRHSTEESLAVVYNVRRNSVVIRTPRDSFLTQMNPWLTNIGYSLCYGTISSKMIRVWYIFNNPVLRKKFVSSFYQDLASYERYLSLSMLKKTVPLCCVLRLLNGRMSRTKCIIKHCWTLGLNFFTIGSLVLYI